MKSVTALPKFCVQLKLKVTSVVHLCGRKMPTRTCSHIMPYNATPNLWWLLLKELLKFFMDMTAPAVARSTASFCWTETQTCKWL